MKKTFVIPTVCIMIAMALLAGCSSAKYIQTGPSAAAKPDDCQIEIFSSKLPDRGYEELGVIEGEGYFGADTLEDVLPKIIKEACRAGGDAIILNPSQKYSDDVDEKINVTATVIRWTD